MSVCAVVGAQFGSEGKGVVVRELAKEYGAHVRTGGPNAGHTFAFNGEVYKLQQLPCGWTNPDAMLIIGPGAVLDEDILRHEADLVAKMMPNVHTRILIDAKAAILSKKHHDAEGGVDGAIHTRIGSTGEGVGACRLDRIRRDPEALKLYETGADTSKVLAGCPSILLEGTQGYGLSLVHGPWPYVTSADTTSAQLCADAGVSPRRLDRVVLVARAMPIRVAGNSGELKGETTWEAVSARLGRAVHERTTVTKKTRRVGLWDWDLMDGAVRVNGATEIVLTFADYINPGDFMVKRWFDLSAETRDFVIEIERRYGIPVTMIGTGFDTTGWSFVDMRDA